MIIFDEEIITGTLNSPLELYGKLGSDGQRGDVKVAFLNYAVRIRLILLL